MENMQKLEEFVLEVKSAFQFLLEMSFKLQCHDLQEDTFFSPFFVISLKDKASKRRIDISYTHAIREPVLRPEVVGVMIYATDRGEASLSVHDYVVSKHPSDEPKLYLDTRSGVFRERIRPVLRYNSDILSNELLSVVKGNEWLEGYDVYMDE